MVDKVIHTDKTHILCRTEGENNAPVLCVSKYDCERVHVPSE